MATYLYPSLAQAKDEAGRQFAGTITPNSRLEKLEYFYASGGPSRTQARCQQQSRGLYASTSPSMCVSGWIWRT